MVVIPTPRDRLLSYLAQGRGDIAAGNLTITEARLKQVDFSIPMLNNVSEIVVTGLDAGPMKSKMDLSGKKIYVRKSSSYYDSLDTLKKELITMGKYPVKLIQVNDHLADIDLL